NKGKLFEVPVEGYVLDQAAYLAAGNTGKEDGTAFLVKTSTGRSIELDDSYDDVNRKLFNLKIDYVTKINEVHNISAFAAYEQFQNRAHGITAYRTGFISR